MSDTNPILTDPSNIGLAALQAQFPTLDGAGVTVGQAEADITGNEFEVDPAMLGANVDPTNSNGFLTYYGDDDGVLASTTIYDDGVIGSFSGHATAVAQQFYGADGVAPGVAHVDMYNAEDYPGTFLAADKVVNMSYLQDPTGAATDSTYDALALADDMVLVGAAGNSGAPSSPSTAYNVISVGNAESLDSVGPAYDGASKPDISGIGTATSYTAPQVSGAAAVLVQAATDGWQGATAQNQTDALDFRTIKALLLNGATKPADYFSGPYAPTATQPLNARYGSGVLNVDNSVNELFGGEHAADQSFSVVAGQSEFVAVSGPALPTLQGWNFSTLTAAAGDDAIDAYRVNLAAGSVFIATLTWASNASNAIDQLDLDLYDNATGQLVFGSDAPDNNVQQVYFDPSASGTYDLQVVLDGTADATLSDQYALAYSGAAVACFCPGTAIRTPGGEVAVERLRVGDAVVTADCRVATVRWVGAQAIARRDADSLRVAPVRIRAGALAEGVPRRDLLLSPGHAVLLDGLLVQAGALVNGTSIVRLAELPARLRYHHVALDTHDLLLAEGVAAESFLEGAEPVRFADRAGDRRRRSCRIRAQSPAGRCRRA